MHAFFSLVRGCVCERSGELSVPLSSMFYSSMFYVLYSQYTLQQSSNKRPYLLRGKSLIDALTELAVPLLLNPSAIDGAHDSVSEEWQREHPKRHSR